MSTNNIVDKPNGTSKLALLRQNRGIQKQNVDIAKAIDGFASSIDDQTMIAEISRNSAIVNFIIDGSESMEGTSIPIAQEFNNFAIRQSRKIYTTKLSLTVFNTQVYPKLIKADTKDFTAISPWNCRGGTNIYDALFIGMDPIQRSDANHILHVITTDGQNGHSRHTQSQVQQLITDRISKNEHVFLLYNDLDNMPGSAQAYAAELRMNPKNAVNFNRDGDGIKILFQAIEDLLDGLRTTGEITDNWAKAITAHASNPLGIKARETKYLE